MTEMLQWRISSFSGSQGSCVQLAKHDNDVLLRNSNYPDAGTLTLQPADLAMLIDAAREGQLDTHT